jgi:hypothetical protein
VAEAAQPLDSIPLIRRKRAGEGAPEPQEAVPQAASPHLPDPSPPEPAPVLIARQVVQKATPEEAADTGLRMKPRETVQLAAVHVRIPEEIARGLRLMSVLENEQAQVIVAQAIENKLNAWNPRWRETVNPPKS